MISCTSLACLMPLLSLVCLRLFGCNVRCQAGPWVALPDFVILSFRFQRHSEIEGQWIAIFKRHTQTCWQSFFKNSGRHLYIISVYIYTYNISINFIYRIIASSGRCECCEPAARCRPLNRQCRHSKSTLSTHPKGPCTWKPVNSSVNSSDFSSVPQG